MREQAEREKREAEEAARLSHLISEDVRKREELRLDRERRERELDRERDSASLEVGAGGEKFVKMMVHPREGKSGAAIEGAVSFKFPLLDGELRLKISIASVADGSTSIDWLVRLFGAITRVSGTEAPATVFVVDILAPYYLSSQGTRATTRSKAHRLSSSSGR